MRITVFRRAFTLLELLVVVVILSILGSLSVFSYQRYRDRVAEMVDKTNQRILAAAIKINATDTGSVAGSLSELRPSDLERAYALVVQGKRPYTMLAYLGEIWQELVGSSVAEAEAYLPARYYNRDLKTITCPSDPDPPTGFDPNTDRPIGGTSYEIRSGPQEAAGKPLSWLLNPDNAEKILLFESDKGQDLDEDCVYRHRGNTECIITRVDGKHRRKIRQGGHHDDDDDN